MTEEVLKIMSSIPTESCKLNSLPAKIMEEVAHKIIQHITRLINISLTEGCFVDTWKMGMVQAPLKKTGLALISNNYRPVSNLSFLSKLLKKCVISQFNKHCSECGLFPDYQLAYREGYSCETALVKLMNDLLWTMEGER